MLERLMVIVEDYEHGKILKHEASARCGEVFQEYGEMEQERVLFALLRAAYLTRGL